MTGFLWSNDADAFFEGAPKRKPESAPGSEQGNPLTVTQINHWIKKTLDRGIPAFWLAGEVGSIMQSGAGHVYLTLKDDSNQISAVIWKSTWEKSRIELKEGTAVLCMGKIDVYGPRGTYQIVVQRIEPQGIGALQLAFRKLHAKLESEGLFRPDRKRPLPAFPSRIGFVTSPHGAAIHDFLEVLRRRWPSTDVLVIPAKVQGAGAAQQIAQGIELAGRIRPTLDVLIVGRGGGSIEDLWCFNEEVVVRALAASPIPTVSAVGHEVDVTLCDLAADVRALTPSEAAERVVPNRDELSDVLHNVQHRLRTWMTHKVRDLETRLAGVVTRPIFEFPKQMFDTPTQRLDEMERRMNEGVARRIESVDRAFEKASARLESLSPIRTLARGYSFTTDAESGKVLTSTSEIEPGRMIQTTLADGVIESQVLKVQPQASAAKLRRG
ncbi:MAG: exodeoxyribonuclease VII large subunit [Planctomycetota bacterium]|jgi:exodeoxyribonuclease VII large subunit